MRHLSIPCLWLALAALDPLPHGTVTMTSTRAEAEVPFPRSPVEKAPRIVAADGGYLDLARAKDGRQLWVRRWWDDGTTDVTRFDLSQPESAKGVLQFVDGIVEPTTRSQLDKVKPSPSDLAMRTFREGADQWFAQRLEAWVLKADEGRIVRPSTGQSYPVLPARGGPAGKASARLQWMVLVPKCPETKSACVYFGDPVDVCGRYFDGTTREAGQELWIVPKKGCRGHW
jgi:hypothetical protein